MASPNLSETETRFVRWFRWSVVNILMPASSFVMLLLGVSMTGVFASSLHPDPTLSRTWQWLSVLIASGAFFVGILCAQDWQRQRERFRERMRNSSS